MKGAEGPARAPKTLYTFNSSEDIQQFATGCDGDIGGLSTVNLDLDTRPEVTEPIGKQATGLFWGDMRLQVKPGFESKIRGGYAGFRNKVRYQAYPFYLWAQGNNLSRLDRHFCLEI